jgi:phosphopentomutase
MSSQPLQRRFFLIVLDGCGAGELPDAHEFGEGDLGSNTLREHGARRRRLASCRHLQALGWGNITPQMALRPGPTRRLPGAAWPRLAGARIP